MVDFGWTQGGKPRAFKNKTPTLTKLGIDNFDQMEKIGDLKFTMEKATEQFQENLHTRESGKVKHMMKLGICREVGSI